MRNSAQHSIVQQLNAFLMHISRHVYEMNLSLQLADTESIENSIQEDFIVSEHRDDNFVMTVLELEGDRSNS